jgi:hypothetical protein
MTTTVKVTYTAQGSPDTVMTFDLTGIDIESINEELPLKKKELDSKFGDTGVDLPHIKNPNVNLDHN